MAAGDSVTSRDYRRIAVTVAVWVVAVGVAAALDPWVTSLAQRFTENVFKLKDTWAGAVLKFPGDFKFTVIVAVVAIFIHPWKWRSGAFLCLCAIVGAVLYTVVKWFVGRRRPTLNMPYEFHPFPGGFHGLIFGEKNLTFPSGHATCAFATAAALAILFPRARYVFYALAAIAGVERILERAHYLSDVVAAAGFGMLSVQIAFLIAKLLDPGPADPQPIEIPAPSGQAEPSGHRESAGR